MCVGLAERKPARKRGLYLFAAQETQLPPEAVDGRQAGQKRASPEPDEAMMSSAFAWGVQVGVPLRKSVAADAQDTHTGWWWRKCFGNMCSLQKKGVIKGRGAGKPMETLEEYTTLSLSLSVSLFKRQKARDCNFVMDT